MQFARRDVLLNCEVTWVYAASMPGMKLRDPFRITETPKDRRARTVDPQRRRRLSIIVSALV